MLVTAGTSTPGLLGDVKVPVRALRKVVGWFQASRAYEAPGFPPFTFLDEGGQFYGFPSSRGGGLKVGRHDEGQVFDPANEPSPWGEEPDEAELRTFLERHLPGAAGPLVQGAACRYDRSDDENFLIDQVPGRPVWFATGFSGHGFKFAPALGFHLARWLTQDECSPLLAPFRPLGRP